MSRFSPRPTIRRHQEPHPQPAGGSASPQGEARREAPARRSAATAAPGRITGGGGRGGANKPYHAPNPTSAPHHTGGSASPQGEARREAPARRSAATAAPGRITGGGGRGGANKPCHPANPRPAPTTPAAAQAVRRRPSLRSHSQAEPLDPTPCRASFRAPILLPLEFLLAWIGDDFGVFWVRGFFFWLLAGHFLSSLGRVEPHCRHRIDAKHLGSRFGLGLDAHL